MTSMIGVSGNQQAERKRNKITITQRRWLLSVHLLFITIWLGSAFCSLALNLTTLFTTDPGLLHDTYVFTDILDHIVVRAGAGGTLLTGILLAVLTQWGLVRFYWIMVKEVVSLLCIAIDFIGIGWNDKILALTGSQDLQVFSNPTYLTNRTLLIVGIVLRIIATAGIIAISIFKPWGQRKRRDQREA